MTSTLALTTAQTSKTSNTQHDGYFDAVVGLPPANTQLGSTYFSGYIKAVASME